MLQAVKKVLKSPVTMLAAVVLGVAAGLLWPSVVVTWKPVNDIYTALLQVSSIPIMICAITVSIGKLFKGDAAGFLGKFLGASFAMIIAASLVGILIPVVMQDALRPSDEVRVTLAKLESSGNDSITDSFSQLNLHSDNDVANAEEFSVTDFVLDTIPTNIFNSLADSETLQIIFFFIVLGVMLSFIDERYSRPVRTAFEGIFKALYKFVNGLLLFLPVSLLIMMAVLFSDDQMIGIMASTVTFLVAIFAGIGVMIAISAFYLAFFRRIPLGQQAHALKDTFFIALGTASKTATLPFALEAATSGMKLPADTVNGTLPVGSVLFPNGKIVSAATLAVYALIIYNVPIDLSAVGILLMTSILYGLSVSSVPAVISANMISIMLAPFGVPASVMSVIMLSTVQLYAGVSTFAGSFSNLAVSAFVAPRDERMKPAKRTRSAQHEAEGPCGPEEDR